jgi:hypothetical protein
VPSDFPGSPKLMKGALVSFEGSVPLPKSIIVFQYNPESVARSLQGHGEADPERTAGDTHHSLPPIERFQVSVELDAVDQLENPRSNSGTVANGLHGPLAALELLMYPNSTVLILNKALALAGSAMVVPASVPLVLLVWGLQRVVPVRVESLSVAETAFDQNLNPIQAKVELGLRTLEESELRAAGRIFEGLSLAQLIAKEIRARETVLGRIPAAIAGLNPF